MKKKTPKEKDPVLPFFALTKNPHPSLSQYAQNPAVKSATFNPETGCYRYKAHGQEISCGGLVNTIKYRFCPHYEDNRSKRRGKRVNVRGSDKKLGKRVDSQLLQYVHVGKRPKRCNPLTAALLDHWHNSGHVLEACQLPVVLGGGWNKMTQADVITRNTLTNQLCLWEVKTGFPVGGFRTQDTFKAPLNKVKCTKYRIWQLQVHYTREGLINGGLFLEAANVIQVYNTKKNGIQIKVHTEEPWLKDAPKIVGGEKKPHRPVLL